MISIFMHEFHPTLLGFLKFFFGSLKAVLDGQQGHNGHYIIAALVSKMYKCTLQILKWFWLARALEGIQPSFHQRA